MQEMNLLLKLSHPSYGADMTMLVRLYKAHLLSRLHYKAVIYSNVGSTCLLTSLDTIHDIVLRLANITFLSDVICSSIE